MKTKTVDEIRHRGFEGFQTIGRLKQTDCRDVPEDDGVYLVIRTAATPPSFLKRSIGGRFKGADPTVDIRVLESKWVEGTPIINVGKAGPGKTTNLRKRLQKYMKFGRGEPVGHRGGRYIWQLKDSDSLIVCWKRTSGTLPREVERALIKEFETKFHCLPFANCNR